MPDKPYSEQSNLERLQNVYDYLKKVLLPIMISDYPERAKGILWISPCIEAVIRDWDNQGESTSWSEKQLEQTAFKELI